MWFKQEWVLFGIFTRFMMVKCLRYSMGNPFAQGISDAATLNNKHRCLAVGIEFFDPD